MVAMKRHLVTHRGVTTALHSFAPKSGTYPERAVSLSLLELGERWDEHLINDVYDPVVHLDVRLKHIRTIGIMTPRSRLLHPRRQDVPTLH